ncbi:chemotaxis protein CheW [Phenylobacterium sp. LjRoot225]|uniref:chemotaxis protein CheW n=1 Tax=Phenylobacterium sp. LjRoot225 TaxID=3342285 RepID=UPI003ED11495
MLHLIFRLDGEAYALEAARIIEILPLVDALRTASASARDAGAINYRGQIVPVLDLAAMTLGRASQRRLSTRIILARCAQSDELVGLIAENATEIQRIEPDDFIANNRADQSANYLGPIALGPRGAIQRIELDHLLPRHRDPSQLLLA